MTTSYHQATIHIEWRFISLPPNSKQYLIIDGRKNMVISAIPIFQGFAYLCTVVATLRAGSRLTYMWLHNGCIGAMEGPLILPVDGENSLWETTYSLEKVVQLASSSDDVIMKNKKSRRHEKRQRKALLSSRPSMSDKNFPFRDLMLSDMTNRNNNNTTLDELSLASHSNNASMAAILTRKNASHRIISFFSAVKLTPRLLTKDAYRRYTSTIAFFSAVKLTPSLLTKGAYRRYTSTIASPFIFLRQYTFQKTSQFITHLSEFYESCFYASWRRSSSGSSLLSSFQNRNVIQTFSAFHSCKTAVITLPTSSNNTETTRQAQVTAIAPAVFQQLRAKFGISEHDYVQSLRTPFISFQSNSKGAARAGLTFFFTRDGAYMIKSIKRTEADTLLKILPTYNAYMKRHARRTLITRICGLYDVSFLDEGQSSWRSRKQTSLLVMNSIFPAEASHFLSERYDLKGSTAGRECTLEEQQRKGVHNAVLKDLNLAKEVLASTTIGGKNINNYGLHLGTRAKAALLSQLRQDVILLAKCGVMDYSLLAGVMKMEGSRNNYPGSSSPHFVALARDFCRRQKNMIFGESPSPDDKNSNNFQHYPPSVDNGKRLMLSSFLRGLPKHVAHLFYPPMRAIAAPFVYVVKKIHSVCDLTLSTVLTLPLPYYGAGICGVDGGALSVLHGERHGRRAVYYFGLIDFLQPWTMRKAIERDLKSLLGYNRHAISCVDPNEYSARLMNFLDAHIS